MVPFKNLSAFDGAPPKDDENRKIAGGPLYSLSEVQALTQQTDALKLWTRRCIQDVAKLGFDTDDVGGLIRELSEQDYRDSEWCDNGKEAWAACDAYMLKRLEFIETAGKYLRIDYFLKFALGKTGKLLLIVSCHTSN
ncbi:MAG: type II toxin-antitoxin system MqsR family toxin [Rhodocyclaceae bacterium]|nr:type II toxin-antitoxin system MqsR family toxin [Rhodocyclaceae bacterium]